MSHRSTSDVSNTHEAALCRQCSGTTAGNENMETLAQRPGIAPGTRQPPGHVRHTADLAFLNVDCALAAMVIGIAFVAIRRVLFQMGAFVFPSGKQVFLGCKNRRTRFVKDSSKSRQG
ncbi:hypothetical protein [Paraburkholderia diazotrophica]|uniref:hypothetical protein n=1 Tax=Paraburkholderia diazotrophica TaxID=667676 RepID=UPI000B87C6C5|nr:hypothetical protein [Paraburkholderia diazotrophica]